MSPEVLEALKVVGIAVGGFLISHLGLLKWRGKPIFPLIPGGPLTPYLKRPAEEAPTGDQGRVSTPAAVLAGDPEAQEILDAVLVVLARKVERAKEEAKAKAVQGLLGTAPAVPPSPAAPAAPTGL